VSKYEKIEDDDIYILKLTEFLRMACCDCGAVHIHAFMVKDSYHYKIARKQNGKDFLKKGEIAFSTRREKGSTAQLRRRKYGYLQQEWKKDKYKLTKKSDEDK